MEHEGVVPVEQLYFGRARQLHLYFVCYPSGVLQQFRLFIASAQETIIRL